MIKINNKELNKLMTWKKDGMGAYIKNINGNDYKVEKNDITDEWHLYVNDEWSTEVETLKEGKLLAICKAYEII